MKKLLQVRASLGSGEFTIGSTEIEIEKETEKQFKFKHGGILNKTGFEIITTGTWREPSPGYAHYEVYCWPEREAYFKYELFSKTLRAMEELQNKLAESFRALSEWSVTND
jgi:hypothetical protein